MTSLPPSAQHCAKHGLFVGRECPLCYRPGKVPMSPTLHCRVCGSRPCICEAQQSHGVGSVPVTTGGSGDRAKRSLEAPKLNKTEQRWLDAHPTHLPFAIRLRWGKTMHYTADFFSPGELIEVKGAHIYDRDIVRFKGCAAEWGWLFTFKMFQWKKGKWTQLY